MEQEQLMKDFEEAFAKMKSELGFKASLEELDQIFFLRDFVLKEGYVSRSLSRMICGRMVETFNGWGNYLHGVVIPNPGSMVNMNEHQMFEDKEKEEIMQIMGKILRLSSQNSINGLSKDIPAQGKFVDEAVAFWNKTLKDNMIQIMKKVNKGWQENGKA